VAGLKLKSGIFFAGEVPLADELKEEYAMMYANAGN